MAPGLKIYIIPRELLFNRKEYYLFPQKMYLKSRHNLYILTLHRPALPFLECFVFTQLELWMMPHIYLGIDFDKLLCSTEMCKD